MWYRLESSEIQQAVGHTVEKAISERAASKV